MKFVNAIPNPSGAYQGPHKAPFPGCLPLTDGQAETLVAYNGFVTITRSPTRRSSSSVTGDPGPGGVGGLDGRPAPEPEPEPTLDERVAGIEAAVQEGLRLYEGDLSNG